MRDSLCGARRTIPLDIKGLLAIKVSLGEQTTVSLERIFMNQKRFLVPESSHRLKTGNANWVKELQGKLPKGIWTHNHPVNINLVTEDDGKSAGQVKNPTKKILRGSGIHPVSAPDGSLETTSAAPTIILDMLDNIDDQIKDPRRSGMVRTEPRRRNTT